MIYLTTGCPYLKWLVKQISRFVDKEEVSLTYHSKGWHQHWTSKVVEVDKISLVLKKDQRMPLVYFPLAIMFFRRTELHKERNPKPNWDNYFVPFLIAIFPGSTNLLRSDSNELMPIGMWLREGETLLMGSQIAYNQFYLRLSFVELTIKDQSFSVHLIENEKNERLLQNKSRLDFY